ncbi:ser/thr protein phosphatase [Purpureocillium lilacinum]|uniref:Ser/thr protein phosphatase n=1 Tax=Purpureocillium lilacinum TaxID=33203 RepID=A0A179FV48_PURLI|nr:ser/thr protein phosphatase [Purpureocillium lilacinum]
MATSQQTDRRQQQSDALPVRIQIMSDLHLETPGFLPMYDTFTITPHAPHLALLGDTGNAHDPRLYAFLETQLRQFEIVFYVLGNHEPYQLDHDDDGTALRAGVHDGDPLPEQEQEQRQEQQGYEDAVRAMRRFEDAVEEKRRGEMARDGSGKASTGRFVFMDRRRFDISDNVTILGCTLFSHITPEQHPTASLFVSDFSSIPSWTVDAHNACHARDLAWLNDQVRALSASLPPPPPPPPAQGAQQQQQQQQQRREQKQRRRILILTHHSPTSDPRANDPEHLDDPRGVQSAFVTDLRGEPCWRSGGAVAAWAFGHTHFNCDFFSVDDDINDDDGGGGDGATKGKRVVANQRGYGREDAYDFDAGKVIEI